jgi:Uma2 family endonuclease
MVATYAEPKEDEMSEEEYCRFALSDGAGQWELVNGRLRISDKNYDVPDMVVVPTEYESALGRQPKSLDAYPEPMPLVVEIWSPSTGDYDIDRKLPEYHVRGDLEIWRLHSRERTLIAWVRQPDGTYLAAVNRGGVV